MKKEMGLGALILFLRPLQTSRGRPIIVFNKEKESKKRWRIFAFFIILYIHTDTNINGVKSMRD